METARKYSEEKLLPRIKEAWKNENTDPSIFKEMGELGLLGATISEEYGLPVIVSTHPRTKDRLEKMKNKLALILSIDEVINGNCIFPVLFK